MWQLFIGRGSCLQLHWLHQSASSSVFTIAILGFQPLTQVLVALAEEAHAEIPDDTSADAEIPGCTSEKPSSSNSPMFDDATLEEVDIDLLIHGVTPPEPIKFRPLSLFCRKPAGLQLGVGRKSGLRPVRLTYTGESLFCSDNFIEHNILGDCNCFFRTISYLLLGQEVNHDVIRARIVDYIMDPNNFDKLRSYIPSITPVVKHTYRVRQWQI